MCIEYAAVVAGRHAASQLTHLWPEGKPEDPAWDWIPLEAELSFYRDLCKLCNDTQAPFRAGASVAFGRHAPDLGRVARVFGLPVRAFAALTTLSGLAYPRLRVHVLDAWRGAVVVRLAPSAILRPPDRSAFVCGLLGAVPVLFGAQEVSVRPVRLSQAGTNTLPEDIRLRGPGDIVVTLDCGAAAADQSPVIVEIQWGAIPTSAPSPMDASDPGVTLDAELATWFFATRTDGALQRALHRIGRFLQAETRRDLTAGARGALPTDSRWRRLYRYVLSRAGAEISITTIERECGVTPDEFGDLTQRFYDATPSEWLWRLRCGIAEDLRQRTDLSDGAIATLCDSDPHNVGSLD